jgi:hypothetical protein
MQDKTEAMIALKVIDVLTCAGEEIVHDRHFVASRKETPCQVRANETRAARDKDFF